MNVKKIKVRSLRNILETPFQTHWLDKSEEEIAAVQNALKECLPAGKLEHKTTNLHFKERKKNERNKNDPKKRQQNIYRTYMAPGFQSVIRGLEKQELCCVVLAREVTPALLQKLVIAYAQASCIPVIVIPHLKDITRSALGFSSMVLGFKNVVADFPENKFHPIYKLVLLNQIVPGPSLMLKTKEDKTSEDVQNPPDNVITNESSNKVLFPNTGNLYLYRQSSCERAFEPKRKTNPTTNSKTKIRKIDDFISLEESVCTQSSSHSHIKNKPICKSYSYDLDDDNSDSDQAVFFVDNKPDDTLLKIEESKPSKSGLKNVSQSKKKKARHYVHDVRSSSNSLSTQKVGSGKKTTVVNKLENSIMNFKSGVKHNPKNVSFSNKKPKKGLNSKMNISKEIIFKPLKIKSIKNNSKKVKKKNKTKRPI